MQFKPRTISTKFPDTMAAPVAIGTRGTVGSLVRKEIEYFTKFELEKSCGSFRKHQCQQMVDVGSKSGDVSKPSSFWSLKMSWKKKKRRGSSSSSNGSLFLPSICSAVEVANGHSNRFNGIPGFSYRILKNDVM